MSGYLESVLVLLCINTVLAYGAFLPMVAGQLNLGVAAFVAIGAYSGGYLSQTYNIHPVFAALAAVVVAGFIGWLVAFPILRTRGIYLALATFALNQVVQGVILNLNVVGGASGYPVSAHIGFPVVAAFAVAVVVLMVGLFHTRFGERGARLFAPAVCAAEADRLQERRDAGRARVLRDHHVLEHRQVRHQSDVLEGAREAPADAKARGQRRDVRRLERDGSRIGRVHAADQVEDRGLAGAIRPDQREALAASDAEREIVDHLEPAEALGEVLYLENHDFLSSTPCGRSDMMAMIRQAKIT